MVCEKCEKKLGRVITPDKWKDGARNTTESGRCPTVRDFVSACSLRGKTGETDAYVNGKYYQRQMDDIFRVYQT